MEKLITWSIKAVLAGKTWCLRLVANCQILLNLTIPIRLNYAYDQALYAMAREEEACAHYGENLSKIRHVKSFVDGYIDGITTRDIPEWFLDRWFTENSQQPLEE